MDNESKIIEAFKGSLKYVGPELKAQLEKMLTPQNLAIMAGVLATYTASHALGVGFAADAILAGVGAIALGSDAIDVAKKLYNFSKLSINAKNEKDLDKASHNLASAMSTVMIDLVSLLKVEKVAKFAAKTGKAVGTVISPKISSLKTSVSSVGKVSKALSHSVSTAPISKDFRVYSSEKTVGKALGKAWSNIDIDSIPTPSKLAKIKGTATSTGAIAFDGVKLQGQTVKQIVSKIPKEAQLRELKPLIKDGKVISDLKGFEYGWKDAVSNMDYRVRIHSADPGAALKNPNSTAAQGWIVRVERAPTGSSEFKDVQYLTIDGMFEKASDLIALETKKKAIEATISSGVGAIPQTKSSATVGNVSFDINSELKKISEAIEHFHHASHIGVGGGLNKAIK